MVEGASGPSPASSPISQEASEPWCLGHTGSPLPHRRRRLGGHHLLRPPFHWGSPAPLNEWEDLSPCIRPSWFWFIPRTLEQVLLDDRLQIQNPGQEDPEVGGIEVPAMLLRHTTPLTCIAPMQDSFSLLGCPFAPSLKFGNMARSGYWFLRCAL